MTDGAPLDIVPIDPALRLRAAIPDDEAFIGRLFHDVRAEQFAAAGLSGPILEQVIAQQFRSQTAGYAAQFPGATSLIVMQQSAAVGRLLLDCTRERWHIIDIALLRHARGRGLGTEIIKALEAGARQQGITALTLSVFASNVAARRLYARQGFAETGPADAAHIAMRKDIA